MKLLYIFLKLGHCNVYQLILSCNLHSLARIKRDVSPIPSPCVLCILPALYLALYLCTPQIVTWPPPGHLTQLRVISKLPSPNRK